MREKKKYMFNLLATYYESEDFLVEAESRDEAEDILHSKTRGQWPKADRVEYMLQEVDGSESHPEADYCFRDYYDE